MNKVYISGRISDNPGFVNREERTAHLMFLLCVRHKTQKGTVKQEVYSVNAWNNTALWGGKNLRQGQPVGMIFVSFRMLVQQLHSKATPHRTKEQPTQGVARMEPRP